MCVNVVSGWKLFAPSAVTDGLVHQCHDASSLFSLFWLEIALLSGCIKSTQLLHGNIVFDDKSIHVIKTENFLLSLFLFVTFECGLFRCSGRLHLYYDANIEKETSYSFDY